MTLSELKALIKTRLTTLSGITVYDGKADEDDTAFPYLCYKFPVTGVSEYRNKDLRQLEIDYWNNDNDDTGILAAAEKVKNGIYSGDTLVTPGFDGSWQTDTSGFYKANLEAEGQIEEPERNMSRYHQRYILEVR